MGVDPIHLAVENADNENAFYMSDKYAAEAVKLIKESEIEAERILARNKLLLLKMAEYLTTHSRMGEEMIEAYVKKYGQEEWIHTEGLIKKDAYYKFNTVLQENIRKLENENVEFEIDRIISEVKEESLT